MKHTSIRMSALVLALGVSWATSAFAQVTDQGAPLGTTADPNFNQSQVANALLLNNNTVFPSATYPNSCYATGGVSLRNRTTGNISVSGCVNVPPAVPVRVTAAFIYWAIIGSGPIGSSTFRLTNIATGAAAIITGLPVGIGPQPCWNGVSITVFKAPIPLGVANTPATVSKSYQLSALSPAGGNKDGSDPWVEPAVIPLWEGASVVLIFGSTAPVVPPSLGTVDLFDVGLAGTTFSPPLSYTLSLSGTSPVKSWDNIGADGQFGFSRVASIASETTTINTLKVAGPTTLGYANANSDWDGSSGFPIPQLWDNTGHDISGIGSTGSLLVQFGGPTGPSSIGGDCLTSVANVVLR